MDLKHLEFSTSDESESMESESCELIDDESAPIQIHTSRQKKSIGNSISGF